MKRVAKVLAVTMLLACGYVAGAGLGGSGGSAPQVAHAEPVFDAASGSYVTGDNSALTFWKVSAGKVTEVTSWHLSADVPAYYETREAGEGANRRVEQVKVFEAGNYIFSTKYVPAPPGMPPPPSPNAYAPAPEPYAAPAPAPGPAAPGACGGGK